MKIALAILSLLVLCSLSVAADPQPFLESAPMPFYPPLARTARVQGTVTLRVAIAQDGTATVETVSGHPLLRYATARYVKAWKFGWEQPCTCTAKKDITFVYKISDREAAPDSPTAIVRWFGTSRVEVETNYSASENILVN
jgi:TonB family protein